MMLLATRSVHKVREIGDILAPLGFTLTSLEGAGIAESPDEASIEAFDTFLANARAKADWFGELTDLPVLADDSGICVDALDGAPGVRSKRFARDMGRADHDLDAANNRALLERLDGVPPARRGAAYVCAAVLRRPDGHVLEAAGSVRGRILDDPIGDGGFGYDPLFFVPALGRTFAQVDARDKHSHSHRARAFRALASHLANAAT